MGTEFGHEISLPPWEKNMERLKMLLFINLLTIEEI